MSYRRSVILINRPFQLRFSIYVLSWLLALSFIYPMMVYSLFDYFIHFASLDPMGPSLAGLQQTRHEVLFLLVSIQAIFLGISFLISVFMSHRIAGPLYKLRLFLGKAKQGNFKEELSFRKKDHFQELAADYNDVMREVRSALGTTVSTLAGSIPELERLASESKQDGKAKLEQVISTLKKLHDTTRARIQ